MTVAAKHFDPQLGIDIHMYVFPPLPIPVPLPTPHIGIVLDPFDYIPVIGAKTHVNGVKRASAASMGLDIHIPLGLFHPAFAPKLPTGPHWDDEIFMGSKTVSSDGLPFSRLSMPVLSCQAFGMIAPVRPNKPKPKKLSMVLPTTLNVAIPNNVVVGGPPTVSLMALLMRGGFAALGKLNRTFRLTQRMGAAFRRFRRRIFSNMKPGTLKCRVLRAEPVDIRDGSVSVTHEDFAIPGRIPLPWKREYASGSAHTGACGYGWETPADVRLEIDAADGFAVLHGLDGISIFPERPGEIGEQHAVVEPVEGARLYRVQGERGEEWRVRIKDGLVYCFTAPPGVVASIPVQTLPIERIEDLCGNHWRFERKDGHLVRIVESGITDESGTLLQGRYIEVESRHGRIDGLQLYDPDTSLHHPLVRYRYDGDGDLVAAVDPLGAARTFEYAQHRMVRHTDRVGLSFHYAYDAKWRVVHAWGDGGLYDYKFRYDDVLNDVEITDSLGHTSIVKFDEYRLPLCEIDPLDGVTVFEYDEVGRTTAIVDPAGLRTEFEYDARGNLLKLTQPDGSVVRTEYDPDDRPIKIVDPNQAEWMQVWDSRGLLTEQTTPLGASRRYEYDAAGQLVVHTDARNAVTCLSYGRHGGLQKVVDPLGGVNAFEHDALGRLLQLEAPSGLKTKYVYDAKGRLLNVLQPGGHTVHAEYDAEGQIIKHIDENGRVTRLEYCGIGQIASRIQADGLAVRYEYDSEERLAAVVNQRGERYEIKRDALGRTVEEIDYWGQRRQYRYDAAGRLVATIDPLGQVVAYAADALGRITRKTLPDIVRPGHLLTEHFKYDKRGELIEFRNACRQVKRKFDADGRLIEESQDGFRIVNSYDPAGNRTLRETSIGNRIAYAFDLRGDVTSVKVNDQVPIEIHRDESGRVVSERLSQNVRRQLRHDDRGLLIAQAVLRGEEPLFETAYHYDQATNLAERHDSEYGIDRYAYDPMGRVLDHTDPHGKLTRFFNDPAGDRLRTKVHEVQMKQVVGGEGSLAKHWTREGHCEGMHYVFDRAGNLVRRGSRGELRLQDSGHDDRDLDLRWDADCRLIESRNGGKSTRYGYDPLGRRVFKRNPTHTTWFFWDGDALLGEVSHENGDNVSAPEHTEKIIDFRAAKQSKRAFETLHKQAREYVYYPDTFIPLSLVDKKVRSVDVRRDRVPPPRSTSVVAEPSGPSRPSKQQIEGAGLGVLGGMTIGHGRSEPARLGSETGTVLGRLGTQRSFEAGTRASGGRGESADVGASKLDQQARQAADMAVPETDEPLGKPEFVTQVFQYHTDPNGCPTRLTDEDGQVVWSASYGAWGGDHRIFSRELENPIRLQGQYHDPETELNYNRYRYFDASAGQFVSKDPLGLNAGENLFRFAPNTLAWTDPYGLKSGPAVRKNSAGQWIDAQGRFATSPSRFAQGMQGSGAYPGVDSYRDIVLTRGTVIYGGTPGQSNFYTTSGALNRANYDRATLWQGLQVAPHPVHGYRSTVAAYVVTVDTPAAFGITRANPAHGAGGLPQIVVNDYENVLKRVDHTDVDLRC